MTQNHQRFQQNQHQHTSQPHESHRPPPGNAQEQRREFLWRERVRLELQVQALLVRGESLSWQWQHLQERKATLGNQLPKVAGQMLIAGLVGIRQLPSEGCTSTRRNGSLKKNIVSSKTSFAAMAMLQGFKRRSRCLISSCLCCERSRCSRCRYNVALQTPLSVGEDRRGHILLYLIPFPSIV